MDEVEQAYRRRWSRLVVSAAMLAAAISMPAQQMVTETRDPAQPQDEEFARLVAAWTTAPFYSSPLVDHLPKVKGVPSPKDVLGHHIGAPATSRIRAGSRRNRSRSSLWPRGRTIT